MLRNSRILAASMGIVALWLSASGGWAQQAAVDFRREIQPILSEHCMQCHGSDSKSRQSGLRLDVRDAALKGGESGKPAIAPGNAHGSEVIARIVSADDDQRMPPPSTKKALTKAQIDAITRWIQAGADYESHWAFTSPRNATSPKADANRSVDAIVAKSLLSKGLRPSPRESNSTLCRRLYLDLIGLPPSPTELDEYERIGFDATVDKLLKSERFGEKWARHWLDVARYSDTNGYEKDLRRDQWAWRDWVVAALNRDLPYDQFLIEQIAGDLLPGPSGKANQERVVATGFLRNSMLNEEGAIVPEQFRMFEMFDRMDCIGKAVLGLTTQCAQCHDHKFDPLTQDEYYGMFAFLNNAYEAQSWVYNDQQLKQLTDIQRRIAEIDDHIRSTKSNWQAEQATWARTIADQTGDWTPIKFSQLECISGLNHPVQLEDMSVLMLGHTSADVFMVGNPDVSGATGLRLEILNHDDLPFGGPGRSATGGWGVLEIEALIKQPEGKEWEKLKFVNASADFSESEQALEGKKKKGPVSFLIDGTDETYWQADRGMGRRNQASVAVVCFDKPLNYPTGTKFKFVMRMNSMVGCCRVSLTSKSDPKAIPVDYSAVLAMATPEAQRSDAQRTAIFSAWTKSLEEFAPQVAAREKLRAEYPSAETSVLHLKERGQNQKRMTHRLDRGEWDRPKESSSPKTPAFLHPFPEGERQDRLGFARWLASNQSPLTARVAVNRIWQAIFGEGLVETSEDFGTRAPVPHQLEILDWLAVDFMEHGWSQKHLVKTIVSSATYQQSAKATHELLEVDPKNQFLARGPRFRCEAEVMRDIALSLSGVISLRAGGPSVIPPVPQNVLDYNYVYPGYWTPAQGSDRYRRSLYVFRKRSMPDPVLSNLDSPNGDMACARRIRSNTPLASLTSLNEAIFVEASQALAIRLLREGGDTDANRIDFGFRLCTGRPCSAREREELLNYLGLMRKRVADGWISAKEVATGNSASLPALPGSTTPQDAAAWTLAARVLLNLDETISKN